MSRTPAVTLPLSSGIHVGIIMDGNGRWAASRGLPRTAGHHAGVRAARAIVESAVRAGVGTLTLYAFSSDNWTRPTPEVTALMRLLRRSLHTESKRCLENGVRLTIVGRRDRLPSALRAAIADAEALTARCRNLHLRVAIDYSSRDGIIRAAERYAHQLVRGTAAEPLTREHFGELLAEVHHDARPVRDVDLLIRTGGEQRLSDFMLWECAYAELYFTPTMWPQFGEEELRESLRVFESRERRFGGVPAQAAS
jgi:undecaprenyl diphosphate synthase